MVQKRRTRKVFRSQEIIFWGRIRAGDTRQQASLAAGFRPAHGDFLFRHAGGMVPRQTPVIHSRYLSLRERERILGGVSRGDSIRQIARDLGRSPSTVWNELRRNRGRAPMYRPKRTTRPPTSTDWYSPSLAQRQAERRLARPKPGKLQQHPRLEFLVASRLKLGHSPAQIMQRLRMDFPDDPSMQISHEAIYRSIYVQGKGELRRELAGCLRSGRAQRVPRERTRQQHEGHGPGKIPGMVMISERPAEVEDRAVPGHWEGDLILGKDGRSQIGTLVERSTRFVILLHLPKRRDAVTVANEMIRQMGHLPDHLRLSVTWDQGKELSDHARIARELELRDGVFFCDPHSPWQRGTNENTNGLLRQYFPKGTKLNGYSQDYLNAVAAELNGRPRKTLNWHTPTEALSKLLQIE
ncbi:IS30 family transposase [Leucobacter luti]|uniref:IS30 family transposase n=1 Tax=Leucobacter luti TaxID=340320 RepID=UPI003D03BC6A